MSYFVNNYRMDHPHQGHISHIGYMVFDTQLECQITRWPSMLVSFYRIDSETAFERHRSRIPFNNVNTVLALKKYLISFLDLKELSSKYGLRDFDMKLYHMAPKSGGKNVNFVLATDEQWNLELPTILAGTGSELNSMYWNGLVVGIDINISVKSLLCYIQRL